MTIKGFEITLVDDGTLRTVVAVTDLNVLGSTRIYRYHPNKTYQYRDESRILDFEAFVNAIVLRDIEIDDFNLWHMRSGTRRE